MVLFWKKTADQKIQTPLARNEFLKRFLKPGDELMTVVGPEDGSCVCGDWVGAVVSVSGSSEEWPALLEALEDGVFHEGCQHRLEAYKQENKVEAEFCTGLALAAMRERQKENSGDTPIACSVDPLTQRQQEFAKVYNAALQADVSGALDAALSKCEAALEILNKENLFDTDQTQVEHVLEARIRGIISQRPQANE